MAVIKSSYLLLSQVVGKVSNHDLGLGRNTVSGRTTLTALTRGASFFLGSLDILVSVVLVGYVSQWLNLCSGLCVSSSRGSGGSIGSLSLAFLLLFSLLELMLIFV